MSLLKNGNELFKNGNILQIFQVSKKKAHKGAVKFVVNQSCKEDSWKIFGGVCKGSIINGKATFEVTTDHFTWHRVAC